MKVLIVDDNHNVAETITDYLELEGVEVDCAYHGEAAIQYVGQFHYDAIIMDIMMPKIDGISTVKKLRHELGCNIPILFLTARDTLEDKIQAFEAGGDDYLLKPFAMQELSLRLKALASRGPRQDIGKLTFADIHIDVGTKEAFRQGKGIKLSHIQFEILRVLLRQAPAIVSRQSVIESVWVKSHQIVTHCAAISMA